LRSKRKNRLFPALLVLNAQKLRKPAQTLAWPYDFTERNAMTEVFFRFPVHCPICKQEWTSSRTKSEIVDALDNNKPLGVYAECHDWRWDLGPNERSELSKRIRPIA
jgi:hypothetical protein